MINGKTTLIAHIGYPTESFKAPLIYNPWFEAKGIDAVVVPMGCRADDYPAFLKAIFRLTNIRGALVTMPHKVTTVALADVVSTTAKIAGSANALLKRPDGSLVADMFDGSGFTRALARKGMRLAGARCLVVGAGGVGSAIAASLAAEGVGAIALHDTNAASAEGLAERLREHYPKLDVSLRDSDPAGYDLAVNATPLGMNARDPLPFDPDRLSPTTFVGEVVMKQEITPLLAAAQKIGCRFVVGTDMLFEMIPAYLEFFGFGTATPDELRVVSRVSY
jgi:shikimate dehydrogenase